MSILGGFGVGLAKGIFDGVNEDAAAERQFKYDSKIAREAEAEKNKALEIEFFNDGMGKSYTYKLDNTGGSEDKDGYHNRSLDNLTKESMKIRPELNNMSVVQFLKSNEDFDGMQGLAEIAKPHMIHIVRPQKRDGSNVTFSNPLTVLSNKGPFWSDIVRPSAEANSGGVLVRDYRKTWNWLKDGETVFGTVVKENENGKLTREAVHMSTFNRNIYKRDNNNNLTEQKMTTQDVVKFLDRKATQKGYKGFSQEQLREQILSLYVRVQDESQDEDLGANFSIMDQIQTEMSFQNLLPNGYSDALNPDNLAGVDKIIKGLPDEVKKNPRLMVTMLAGAFSNRNTLQDSDGGGPSTVFDNFAKRIGFEKGETLRLELDNLKKPLRRIASIKTMFSPGGTLEGQEIALAASGIKFIDGVVEQVGLIGKSLGIDPDKRGGILNKITSLGQSGNKKIAEEGKKLNAQENVLYESLQDAQKAMTNVDSKSPQYKKLKKAQAIAVVQYQSFLLAFEMAAAVQGGGDSRTISNKDVELMQRALSLSAFTSTAAFTAILTEIEGDLKNVQAVQMYAKLALDSGQLDQLKAYAVLESTNYKISNLSNGAFPTLAEKYMQKAESYHGGKEQAEKYITKNELDYRSTGIVSGKTIDPKKRNQILNTKVTIGDINKPFKDHFEGIENMDDAARLLVSMTGVPEDAEDAQQKIKDWYQDFAVDQLGLGSIDDLADFFEGAVREVFEKEILKMINN